MAVKRGRPKQARVTLSYQITSRRKESATRREASFCATEMRRKATAFLARQKLRFLSALGVAVVRTEKKLLFWRMKSGNYLISAQK